MTASALAEQPATTPASTGPTPRDREHIAELVCGHMATHVIGAAVRLGVADALVDAPADALADALADELGAAPGDGPVDEPYDAVRAPDHVARLIGCREAETLRLLRALTALGLVHEDDLGRFGLTPRGQLLRADQPGTMRDFVLMTTDRAMLGAWAELPAAVRDGGPVFGEVFGGSFFDHLGRDAGLSARFNAAMNQGTRLAGQVLPAAYDFAALGTLADVGGGDGSLLGAILTEHPTLSGWVLDTEEGLAQAPGVLARAGVGERAATVVGDFFDRVPPGASGYLLKSILHDWDDDAAARILSRIREVVPDEGRLLVVDAVLPDHAVADRATLGYLGDLNMLVQLGGRERTASRLRQALRAHRVRAALGDGPRAGTLLAGRGGAGSMSPDQLADPFATPEGVPLPGRRFADASALESWLEAHHDDADELWVAFPKKGVEADTVSRGESVDVVLCFGWIDGLARSRDCPDGWWVQRFTPRRSRSVWSKINRVRVEKLIREGRMRPEGLAQVQRARDSGRWDAAYDSPSRAVPPAELAEALAARAGAAEAFEALTSTERYAIIVRLQRLRRSETRARHATSFVLDLVPDDQASPTTSPSPGE